jgi:hypothetical protein
MTTRLFQISMAMPCADASDNQRTFSSSYFSRDCSFVNTESNPHDSRGLRIVACGHRSVRISKSGLLFPAWMVEFAGADESSLSLRSTSEIAASKKWCCWWRSKRDFLLLGRVTRKHALPWTAAAWGKLSVAAPWIPPGVVAIGNAEAVNNWKPNMTKSLFLVNQYLQRLDDLCSRADVHPEVLLAWQTFCRPEDTQDLASADDDSNESNVAMDDAFGNSLGQYFCSPDNGRQLVECFWNRLEPLIRHSSAATRIVEPSCGHGDVIRCLMAMLAAISKRSDSKIISVLGLDLDPTVVDHCRRLMNQDPIPLTGLPLFECANADFLQTRPSDFFCNNNAPPATVIAMIGGPPYSARKGANAKDKNDPPVRVVEYAVNEWKASVVAFLMPARCRDFRYRLPANYKTETIELANESIFFFRGVRKVTQPSIIQCFWKMT